MNITQTSVQLIRNGKTPIGAIIQHEGHAIIFTLKEASEDEAVDLLKDSVGKE